MFLVVLLILRLHPNLENDVPTVLTKVAVLILAEQSTGSEGGVALQRLTVLPERLVALDYVESAIQDARPSWSVYFDAFPKNGKKWCEWSCWLSLFRH